MTNCTFHRAELRGEVDTFGAFDEPLCISCYHELQEVYRNEREDGQRLRVEEREARAELNRLRNEHRNIKKRFRINPTPRNRARLRRLGRQMRVATDREEGLYWAVRMRPPSYDWLLAKGGSE